MDTAVSPPPPPAKPHTTQRQDQHNIADGFVCTRNAEMAGKCKHFAGIRKIVQTTADDRYYEVIPLTSHWDHYYPLRLERFAQHYDRFSRSTTPYYSKWTATKTNTNTANSAYARKTLQMNMLERVHQHSSASRLIFNNFPQTFSRHILYEWRNERVRYISNSDSF